MSAPRSPSLPAERETSPTSSVDADSPSRKRSHDSMVAGQQGAHASPVQTTSHYDSDDDIHPSSTPTRSNAPGNTRAEQSESQSQPNDDEMDPEIPLDEFDWTELEQRYHDTMKERAQEEQDLAEEFQHLMNFFHIWAGTISNHEVDRTFTRFRTRVAHVQYAEEELEDRRRHYMKVVAAFESALRLLNG